MRNKKVNISDFQQADSIPEESIKKSIQILRNGNLFRYIGDSPQDSEVALLERDFTKYLGAKYALALNSCSSAMFLALMCCGVKPGDKVLIPAFTFTAVPSAVIHAGAIPVLVECDKRYCIDIEDLEKNISPKTKVLLLSHMRGHVSDMDRIIKLCNEKKITLIEDAAHGLGVLWNKKAAGTLGKVGCYSFQSHKIINAGEGGLLVTDDEDIIVKAIYLSGAFEKSYEKHFVQSKLFRKYKNIFPAFNLRMDNVSAAIIRPQIKEIEKKVSLYNRNYKYLVNKLSVLKNIHVPSADPRERRSPDSIQFNLEGLSRDQVRKFMNKVRERGVSLFVLGLHPDNVRVFWNWKYLGNMPSLKNTRNMLESACDMRLPVSLNKSQIAYIADVITSTLNEIQKTPKKSKTLLHRSSACS